MDFLTNAWDTFLGLIKSFQVTDALDIILVSFILYNAIKLVRETRAEQLIKGLLILCVVWAAAFYLQLYMVSNILSYIFQFGVIAIIVLFQPEIRRALEQLGRKGIETKYWSLGNFSKSSEETEKRCRTCIQATVDAVVELQRLKMGALIVFEMQTKLGDIIDSGTVINAQPSAQMIGNIFFNKAPLHDGAMVIRDGMICAAGCILPLTKSDKVSVSLGTRHRAALGMSEVSDAIVVVVSEETGQISLARQGVLARNFTKDTLKSELEKLILSQYANKNTGETKSKRFPSIRKGKKK